MIHPSPVQTGIKKKVRIDCAHILPRHAGQCKNVHGHTYTIELEAYGDVNPDTGMLMDFADLKAAAKFYLDGMDHAFLLSFDTPLALAKALAIYKTFLIPKKQTTAENIAEYLAKNIWLQLPEKVQARLHWFAVTVHETPDSSARHVYMPGEAFWMEERIAEDEGRRD